MSTPTDREALLAWIEGRTDTPPADIDEALLASDDPALDAAFADVARQLAIPDPDDGVIDAAWDQVQGRLATDNNLITPPVKAQRRWGMLIGAGLALAAGLLVFALRPVKPPPADPYVKGAGALTLEVEFMREDGATFGRTVALTDRLVAQARLTEPGFLTLAHVGPGGTIEVLPYAPASLPPGVHRPVKDGAPMAYAFDGEPGTHRFVVFASRAAPSPAQVERWLAASPTNVTARSITIEAR